MKTVLEALHKRGVHGLWPYNPWDQVRTLHPNPDPNPNPIPDQGTHGGTNNHTAAGIKDAKRLAALLTDTNSDGFFGDTISSAGLQV
jgi:hypothetical protein